MERKHIKAKKLCYTLTVAILFLGMSVGNIFASSFFPPNGRTGSPADGFRTCNSTECHNSFGLNTGSANFSISAQSNYTLGEVVTVTVSFSDSSTSMHGFELSALDANNNPVGSFSTVDFNAQVSGDYIKHTLFGSNQSGNASWQVQWTAPYTAVTDPVTFYATGNEADGGGTPADDYIYTATTTISEGVAGTNPTPDIKANNSAGPITIGTSDSLSISISHNARSSLGVDCDWWVATATPFGWYCFDASTMSWDYAGSSYTDLSPMNQGSLFDLTTFEVLNMSGLPVGTYTFYFAVDTNMDGSLSMEQIYNDSVDVKIIEGSLANTTPLANTPPTANITSPSNSNTYISGDSITFNGSGSDNEDGALSGSSLVWTSSRDGQIGSGTSFTSSGLSVGTHTITLAVTDSQGATGSDSVSITVESTSTANWYGSWSCDGLIDGVPVPIGTCGVSGGSLSLVLVDDLADIEPYLYMHGTITFSGSPCGILSMDIVGGLFIDKTIRLLGGSNGMAVSLKIVNFSGISMSGRYEVVDLSTLSCINTGSFSLNK